MILPFFRLMQRYVLVAAVAANCLPIAQLALLDVASGHMELPYQNTAVMADRGDGRCARFLVKEVSFLSISNSL